MKNLTPIIETFFPFPYLNSICVINIAIIVFMRIFAVFRVRVWIRTHFACWIRIHIWNSYLVNICIAFKGKINDLNKKKFRSIFYNIVPLILIKIYLFFSHSFLKQKKSGSGSVYKNARIWTTNIKNLRFQNLKIQKGPPKMFCPVFGLMSGFPSPSNPPAVLQVSAFIHKNLPVPGVYILTFHNKLLFNHALLTFTKIIIFIIIII